MMCPAHHTETPEERQRKLDEARKRVQQDIMAKTAFPGPFEKPDKYDHAKYMHGVSEAVERDSPDFGAQVSDQLAQQRGIDRKAANDHMRVRTFEEQEAERARMAEHFRRAGIL